MAFRKVYDNDAMKPFGGKGGYRVEQLIGDQPQTGEIRTIAAVQQEEMADALLDNLLGQPHGLPTAHDEAIWY